MTDTFTWRGNGESISGGGEFNVASAKFGDGYQQDASIGLNPETQTWTVSVEEYRAYVLAALNFIRSKQGSEAFFWTPPLGVKGYYKCKKYSSITYKGGGYYTVSLEFEQAFFP